MVNAGSIGRSNLFIGCLNKSLFIESFCNHLSFNSMGKDIRKEEGDVKSKKMIESRKTKKEIKEDRLTQRHIGKQTDRQTE